MHVIGTAGHVDHGKSTLIRALTGMDPDRLREEKARGMTIELGFAWLALPSGLEVSIVDVPGHERFIKNMLMGVGGIDLALLIVAADEGVMPQTREHVAILDLLEVRRGIVVITKSDLVDAEWLELVCADVAEVLSGTSLKGAPVIPVSAEQGAGLNELMQTIDAALANLPPKTDVGRPRLPVDRSFTISGFGAVVTGTLADGRLRAGQEVEILPSGKRARVRGLQSHRHSVNEALPGTRVAVNLNGVEHTEVSRGDVITIPRWLKPSSAFDASFRVVTDAPRPVRHNHRVFVYSGTLESPATVRLLEQDELKPGATGWVQLRLEVPSPMVKGDYFIVRDTESTLGGGRVVDLDPPRHRRRHGPTIERLKSLSQGSETDLLLGALEKSQPATAAALARTANLSQAQALGLAEQLAAESLAVRLETGSDPLFFTSATWADMEGKAQEALAQYHALYPLRTGMPREELRSRLGLKAAAFGPTVSELERRQVLVASDASVRLPAHDPRPTPVQEQAMSDYLSRLGASPFAPPTDAPLDPELLQVLLDRGEVVRAMDEVVFLTSAYEEMLSRVRELAAGGREITINDVREMFQTSRKYTLAFLEHLDARQITRRTGDTRVLW